MRKLFFLLLLMTPQAFAVEGPIMTQNSPFMAQEDAHFMPAKGTWGMLSSRHFLGTYLRNEATHQDFMQVGLFDMDPIPKPVIDENLCLTAAEIAVGPLEGPLKAEPVKYMNLAQGASCEVRINNSNPKTPHPQQRIFVLFFQMRPYIFQLKMTKPQQHPNSYEVLNFIQDLHMTAQESSRRRPNSAKAAVETSSKKSTKAKK